MTDAAASDEDLLARLEEIAAHHAEGKRMISERLGIWRTLIARKVSKTEIAKASDCTIDNVNQGIAYVPAKDRKATAGG